MSTWMRSLVGWSVTAPEYGRTCVPGGLVDLAERLPRGGTLRDVVQIDWFEPAVQLTAAPKTRPSRPKPLSEPVEPAKE